MRASEKGGCLNAVGSISTAEHLRRLAKELNRQPLMTELIARTWTKKTRGFVDERTQKAMDDYQTLLVRFLNINPQYTPRPGEPLHPDVDFYLWSKVIGGKGPNGYFFGGGNLAGTLRPDDRTLYQRIIDGEGGSRLVTLTPEQQETVRQLAVNEARRDAAER
ncbi:uncharacterized protein LOC131651811 [Vicia villosa]|uniref:uncharacterized protein LOC131651811 n=1 Tax=Vicia villosa TaxID=3911 RepID=UPI00273BD449|nr:uncharacterized protein LOC131651811 [Vicia villosa]